MALAEARCSLAEALAAAAGSAGGRAQRAEHAAAAEAAMGGALAACDAAHRITRRHSAATVVLAETLTAASKASGAQHASVPPSLPQHAHAPRRRHAVSVKFKGYPVCALTVVV